MVTSIGLSVGYLIVMRTKLFKDVLLRNIYSISEPQIIKKRKAIGTARILKSRFRFLYPIDPLSMDKPLIAQTKLLTPNKMKYKSKDKIIIGISIIIICIDSPIKIYINRTSQSEKWGLGIKFMVTSIVLLVGVVAMQSRCSSHLCLNF